MTTQADGASPFSTARLAYGQRLAASSQPAPRAGGLAVWAPTACGIRTGCGGGAVAAKLGLGASASCSFSSESSGAAMRKASTSFSSLVSSSSFCRKTSYTFFMLGHLFEQGISAEYGSTGHLSRKTAIGSSRVVIEAWLPKDDDCDQDAQYQDDDRQQIDVVPQPRFLWGRRVCEKVRHEFLRSRPRSRTKRPAPARAASRYPSSHNRGSAFSPRKRGIRRKRISARGAWPRGLQRVLATKLRATRQEGLWARRTPG